MFLWSGAQEFKLFRSRLKIKCNGQGVLSSDQLKTKCNGQGVLSSDQCEKKKNVHISV